MPNPSVIDCPANAWTKVLTNVKTGNIAVTKVGHYFVTFKLTGEAAPTSIDSVKALVNEAEVRSSVGIDVYVYSQETAGEVAPYAGVQMIGDGAISTVGGGGGGGDVNLIEVGGTSVAAGNAAMAASIPMTVASDDTLTTAIKTSVEIMDDWDESDRCKSNPIVGQAGVAAGSGANGATVQRVTMATDDTVATDLTAIRVAAEDPLDEKVLHESLVDTTNITGTNYYPNSDGFEMLGYKDMSLSGKLIITTDTLTLTVEVTNDEDTSGGDWVQVYGYDDKNDLNDNSWAVTDDTLTFALSFNEMNYRHARVKIVASGATNTAICKMRRKAL